MGLMKHYYQLEQEGQTTRFHSAKMRIVDNPLSLFPKQEISIQELNIPVEKVVDKYATDPDAAQLDRDWRSIISRKRTIGSVLQDRVKRV